MRKQIINIALGAIAISLAACQGEKHGIKRFSFLEGKWQSSGTDVFEVWQFNGDSLLVGSSYKKDGTDSTFYANLLIAQQPNDEVIYQMNRVYKGESVKFNLIVDTPDSIVFENKFSLMPQRFVYYNPKGGAEMKVAVEGRNENRNVRFNFIYIKR